MMMMMMMIIMMMMLMMMMMMMMMVKMMMVMRTMTRTTTITRLTFASNFCSVGSVCKHIERVYLEAQECLYAHQESLSESSVAVQIQSGCVRAMGQRL